MSNEIAQPINYRKLLTEFTVIVVGVFVAVAAESWWSDREERQFEAELREDMVTEFQSNIDILRSDLAQNGPINKEINTFADLSDTELLNLTDDHLNEHYSEFINWAGFDPVMGNVQAIVDSGKLSVISDRKLRLLLSRWSGLLTTGRRYVLQTVQFQFVILEPVRSDIRSDLIWTDIERRKLQGSYEAMVILHGTVIRNQNELLDVADEISEYLSTSE